MPDALKLAAAWRDDPTGDPDVIEPMCDMLIAQHEEIANLKKSLLEAPLAAEMMKQLPNAMRLRTSETDDLRAALRTALDRLGEGACDDPGCDDADPFLVEARKLL